MTERSGAQTEAVIHEVAQMCEERGLRLTDTRRRVLELILAQSGGIKAYDLLSQLQAESPSAKPPTVYRALDFLVENGFVHRVESQNAFFSCTHPADQHAFQVLICDQCGDIEEIHSDSIDRALDKEARQHQFRLRKKNVEIIGTCPRCCDFSRRVTP